MSAWDESKKFIGGFGKMALVIANLFNSSDCIDKYIMSNCTVRGKDG